MNPILLTQNSGKILGPIAWILGKMINWIFVLLDKIHIPNIGLAIIIFTVVIYLLLLPLTIKQQKFSKLSAKMNPEIKAIQDKYKGKKDNESMQKQNDELQAVYSKYGVSPTGSCIQLLIQMPILLALYRVIYNIPAYIPLVKEQFLELSNLILSANPNASIVSESNIAGLSGAKQFLKNVFNIDSIIDVLNKCSSSDWSEISSIIPNSAEVVTKTHEAFLNFNNFLGLNIADTPSFMFSTGLSSKDFLLIIGALSIPVLAAVTQWLNVLFMPQPASDPDNPMASSMKSMNVMMPIMSAVFCFTLPAGMGIYWIASAVVRSIQQVCINKYIDKMDLDSLIEKNKAKYEKKIEKNNLKSGGVTGNTLKNNASMKTKTIISKNDSVVNNGNYKKDSLTAKANLVKNFNDNK